MPLDHLSVFFVKLSQREKMPHSAAYMCNLEKWYRRSYLQGRNREEDVLNGYMDTRGQGELG